jgi:hypothetical protein
MALKRSGITLLIAATAAAVSLAVAPNGSADTSSVQRSCAAQTDANTACQWPSSTSAETNNTDGAPFESGRAFGPR